MGTVSGSGTFWVIQSKDWDADIPAGGHLDVPFIVFHSRDVRPSVINLSLNGEEVCGGGEVCYNGYVPGPSCDGDYNVESDTGAIVNVEVDIEVTEVRSGRREGYCLIFSQLTWFQTFYIGDFELSLGAFYCITLYKISL